MQPLYGSAYRKARVHIDLESLIESRTFKSSICIVGAGIAGLILARELAGNGFTIHLLEAGGLDFEQRSQDLYNASSSEDRHLGATMGRFRTFGGSSTQWGGQLLPFTADIFEPPLGSPSAAWPIAESELTPYYEKVQRIMGVDSLPWSEDFLRSVGVNDQLGSEDVILRFSKWAPFNKRNLANTVGVEVIGAEKVTVFSHANAACFLVEPDNKRKVRTIRVLNYAGKEFSFTAEHFILCAGTIESSRLLLLSPDVPDPHDQIGRYFHDHIAYHAAQFASPARDRIIERLGPYYVDGTIHSCKMEASPALRAREGLLAVMAHVVIEEPEGSGVSAVRNILKAMQSGQLRQAICHNIIPAVRGLGDVMRTFYASRFLKRRFIGKGAVLKLSIDVEQALSYDNRVRLSDTSTDSLGLATTRLEWRVGDKELGSATRYAAIIRDFLEARGLAPQEWIPSDIVSAKSAMVDTFHAMGGLLMGNNPETSVVDRDLAVHQLDNLYVASCAVFPSGSSSNPTFTLMALSLRLAAHITRIGSLK